MYSIYHQVNLILNLVFYLLYVETTRLLTQLLCRNCQQCLMITMFMRKDLGWQEIAS
jgi:hypothetical protein